MRNNTRKMHIPQIILMAVLLLMTLVIFFVDLGGATYLQLSWLVVADIFVCLLLFAVNKTAQVKNACFLFWGITTIFSFGQNIAYIFMSENAGLNVSFVYRNGYAFSEVVKGTVFTILAYNFFSIGLAVGTKKVQVPAEQKASLVGKKYTGAILLVGKLLLAVSVLPQLVYMYEEIQLFFSSGYGFSTYEQLPNIISILRYWFIPGLLMCYVGNAIREKKPVFETAVLLVVAVLYMMIGDRGNSLALLLVVIWLREIFHYGKKRTTYILCVVLVLLIPLVKIFRTDFGADDALTNAITEIAEVNPILDLLLELGSTQEIIFMTMRRVANEGFAYGTAYLDFLIVMLPGFLGFSVFYGNLAQWVLDTTNYQTRGFSIWGEAYLNFGMWGIPFMFLLGKGFRLLFGATEDDSPVKVILTAISLYFFADIVRRAVSGFGFNFLYNIILPVVAVYVIYDLFKKQRISN